MTQDIIYTDSAIVDKLVEYFTNYKHEGKVNQFFYDLLYVNVINGRKIQIPIKTLESIWNILPLTKYKFRQLMSRAIIQYMKSQSSDSIVDGLVNNNRIDWEVI